MVVSSPTAQTCARHSCARRPSGAAPPSAPASATPTSEACSLAPLLAGSLAGCSNPLPARPPRPFSTSPSPAGATFLRTNLSRATFRGADLVRRPRARRRVLVCAPLACAEARGDDTRHIELTGLTLPRLDSRPPTARHPPQEGADFTLARGTTPSTFDMARGHFKACGEYGPSYSDEHSRGATDSAVSASQTQLSLPVSVRALVFTRCSESTARHAGPCWCSRP